VRGKEILTSNEKYYVVDLGLKNIIQTNRYDSDLGHKLENVVYFELLRRGGNIYVGKNHNQEIDFAVQKSGNRWEYYQVAYTLDGEKIMNRELSPLKNLRNSYPKYVLTLDYDDAVIDGIVKKNVIDWLLESK